MHLQKTNNSFLFFFAISCKFQIICSVENIILVCSLCRSLDEENTEAHPNSTKYELL